MISKDEIEWARCADLVAYLLSTGVELQREPGKARDGSLQYRVPGMGGMIVSGSRWYHFSAGRGGNAIDYLVEYQGMTFSDAVKELTKTPENFIRLPKTCPIVQTSPLRERQKFELPLRAKNDNMVIAYLRKQRCIPTNLIKTVINEGLLYQDKNDNCVFVCRDAKGMPRGAYLRGTRKKRYVGLAKGSDRQYGWRRMSRSSNTVIVAESPIDLLSLLVMQPRATKHAHLLSLNGLCLTALFKMVEDSPEIINILLALDNDAPAWDAASKFCDKAKASKMDMNVKMMVPAGPTKDWNDVLCHGRGL